MQIINVEHPLQEKQRPLEDTVLIMGFFDGVHLGHQKVIKTGVELAKEHNLKSILLTFDRSPRTVYQHEKNFKYLSTPKRKAELVEKLGVDYLYFVKFSEAFAKLKPQEFVDQYMIDLKAKYVVAGFDYTYGKKDIANMANLPNYARNSFETVTVPEQLINNQKIGSSAIKRFITSDKIAMANEFLGYNYQNQGTVIHGLQRGRTLGFPTANIAVDGDQVLPSIGVYATRIKVDGVWYKSMTSVGYNVTFKENTGITVETNIFGFDRDIYGKHVSVEWVKYLRGEIKFSGAEGLIAQLELDKKNSIEIL
ncbi:riboflavin biosynthesis protein RibF [Companilactobacillus halodurans]|uniref:Riboflavin biosynthesis protein n=1 Tax=Companilactobacillus halodurans TaxID=2584183 RepID=A0A5P0ZLJ5_9LACO|nr:riboflavin biosynthesis protein RibF [Companilactobacillus halodurans]MQS75120.1 riboflavin biosynthesis protein RibF [Companilactobacillus halodurans]MQS97727.1 riboflavin biosynthesis protein RibF [Companilactobacillus halodurans]